MISGMQVLFLTAALISLLVAVLVYLVFGRDTDRSARFWINGSILMALGMAMLAYRSIMPAWVAFGVTNYVLLQAIVFYGYSVITLYRAEYKVSNLGIALCASYGLIQWGLSATGQGKYLALVASVAWTLAHIWILVSMLHLRRTKPDSPVMSFAILALLGALVWGGRIYLVIAVDITLSTELNRFNFISLFAAHVILLGQQISYLTTRLTDEKDKKQEIVRLNESIEKLWQERQSLIVEKEASRKELLQDVHDGFGSKLVSAQLLAQRGMLSSTEFSDYLKELVNDLHLLVDTLNRDEPRFEDAIADFRYRIQRRHANMCPKINWFVDLHDLPALKPKVTLQLLRIAQEALSNALKHANAQNIDMTVFYESSQSLLTLAVCDDGQGWSEPGGRGQGLNNMEQRARNIGASLILSKKTKGTELSVRLVI